MGGNNVCVVYIICRLTLLLRRKFSLRLINQSPLRLINQANLSHNAFTMKVFGYDISWTAESSLVEAGPDVSSVHATEPILPLADSTTGSATDSIPQRSKSMERHKKTKETSPPERWADTYANIVLLDDLRAHQPLFSRKLLEQEARDVEQARDSTGSSEPITVPHVIGSGSCVMMPREWGKSSWGWAHEVFLHHSHDIAKFFGGKTAFFIAPSSEKYVTASNTLKPNEPQHPLPQQIP